MPKNNVVNMVVENRDTNFTGALFVYASFRLQEGNEYCCRKITKLYVAVN